MKVLHVNCNYVGTSLHRIMVSHLSDPMINTVVYTPLWDRQQKEQFKAQTNEIIDVCFNKYDRVFYFLKQRKIFHSLSRHVKSLDEFDLIHAFTLFTDGNVAYKLHKKYNTPYVVAIRDTDVNSFFRLKPYLIPLGIRILRNASAVFFLSDSYKKNVIERYVPPIYQEEIKSKTYVIPNGIDDFWLNHKYYEKNNDATEARIARKEISIICVGRINKRKNIPTLQKALSILQKRGWKIEFRLIGKVEDQSVFKEIRRDKNTTYYPPMSKDQLINFYRKADMFVLASHTETFGLVYAEALSQGLPVIYTKGQGFDGQFPNGEVGVSVSDTDPIGIADAIERVCVDYRRISGNVAACAERFRWDGICGKYREIYRGITHVKD